MTNEQIKEIFILGMEYQTFINKKEKELKQKLEKGQELEKALDDLMQAYTKNEYDIYTIELNCFDLYAKTYIYYSYFEKGFLIKKVEYYNADDELITELEFEK